jgi:lipoyl(octanoyl) transferase
VDYEEGLRLQAEIADHVVAGRLQNVLLLLEHPPVLTLGRNADRNNVLASDALLAARGVSLHHINRGGDVTYHGPGQLVGYPIFDLRTLKNASGRRMGPVDFVRGMEEALIRVCAAYGVPAGRVPGLTGVWCGVRPAPTDPASEDNAPSQGQERKIAAIGIHVSRGVTSHGFAMNLSTDLSDFNLIIPCGIPDHAVTSLAKELDAAKEAPSLESLAHQASRQFGIFFDQPELAFENLEALRTSAAAASREFPAEDTPLQIPPEIQRLAGRADAPVKA